MQDITVKNNISIKKAMQILQRTAKKTLIVVNKNNKLLGTLSDGDIRRSILEGAKFNDKITNSYEKNPVKVEKGKFSKGLLIGVMRKKNLTIVPIVNKSNKLLSLLTWEDLLYLKKIKVKKKLNIPTLIMAGGKGTRLDPFTNVLPKPLIPIGDKTVIEHIIDKFLIFGISSYYLSINHKAKILKSFFQEFNSNIKIKFIEEKKQLGTAGSISFLKNKIKNNFFVTNCDIIVDVNLNDLLTFHKKNNFAITALVAEKNYKIPYGVCEIDELNNLKKINEKPKYNFFANTGFYILNKKVINLIPKNKFFDMTDLIYKAKKRKLKVGVYPIPETAWNDVGQWDEYKKTLKNFK
mgnify:CR=1 FL=1|tara:strand:+ start:586 stop:1638 length:1053 start_codon:yes stop_codon:yes gene_type:complete